MLLNTFCITNWVLHPKDYNCTLSKVALTFTWRFLLEVRNKVKQKNANYVAVLFCSDTAVTTFTQKIETSLS